MYNSSINNIFKINMAECKKMGDFILYAASVIKVV